MIDTVYMDYSFTLEIGVIYDTNLYDKYLNDNKYQLALNNLNISN